LVEEAAFQLGATTERGKAAPVPLAAPKHDPERRDFVSTSISDVFVPRGMS